ncbi:MAG: primosomal protein N' [Clostridia bacterium]|nr:primosomal protein N' [Clostridia bacterium]
MIFEVIVDISNSEVDRVFDYIGDESIQVGCRVLVPFGNRKIEGFVIGRKEKTDYDLDKLKSIIKRLDDFVTISPELIELMHFMVARFNVRLIDALRLFLPAQMRGGRVGELKKNVVGINRAIAIDQMLASIKSSAKQQRALLCYLDENDFEDFTKLANEFGNGAIRKLEEKGFVVVKQVAKSRIPYKNLAKKKTEFVHTQDQQNAIDTIINGKKDSFLLFGVTGSGKTEIYMSVIDYYLSQNKTAIMLVPEISLTPNMLKLFRSRYDDQVAILHSGLSVGERFDEWLRLKRGEAKIALGARSAVFAPLQNIGVIIIDEEHDSSYHSDSNPRYSTAEIAQFRRKYNDAKLVLGSATPAVETFFKAQQGEYQLIELKNRINKRPMPEVGIVDMGLELRRGNKSFFSERLLEEIKSTVKNGNQIILFLNRRGFSSFVMCTKCGYTAKCHDCDVSLSFHSDENLLKCHYCGKRYRMFDLCPECKSPFIRQGKIGTERVVNELKKLFPDVNILRMDVDTTQNKEAHSKIIESFANHEAQILVGTQMVAKGHDFKDVTLVGILDADQSLHFEDYRAGERTFQLLTQVSGRSGRDEKPGRVILQTYSPKHVVLQLASKQDYLSFYRKEINVREVTGFPPYSTLIRILYSSENEQNVISTLNAQFAELQELRNSDENIVFLTKMKSPVKKIEKKYRFQILLRIKDEICDDLLQKIFEICDKKTYKDVSVFVERNPQNLT